jgi:NADH-quinone oxidoreductase subunit C
VSERTNDEASPDATGAQAVGNVPATTEAGPDIVAVRQGMFGQRDTGDTSGFGGLIRHISLPGSSPRPYGEWFDAAVDTLAETLEADAAEGGPGFAGAVEKVVVDRGELTLYVRRESLLAVLAALRNEPDLRFELSLGVSGVHYPAETDRELHAVYHLLSITHNRRIRVETTCPDADPHVPSSVSIYPTHDWHERETWDFFGIIFDGHPALTRIEMPDDWPGHPQRKDYPLGGIPVEYKGATIAPPDTRRSYS